MKLVTTLQNIKENTDPYKTIWHELLEKMGQDLDNPDLSAEVSLRFILESLGLRNALSSVIVFPELEPSIKLYSLWCVEKVLRWENDDMLQAQTKEFIRLINCYESGVEYKI